MMSRIRGWDITLRISYIRIMRYHPVSIMRIELSNVVAFMLIFIFRLLLSHQAAGALTKCYYLR